VLVKGQTFATIYVGNGNSSELVDTNSTFSQMASRVTSYTHSVTVENSVQVSRSLCGLTLQCGSLFISVALRPRLRLELQQSKFTTRCIT
jgi:hypothetical protein